MSKLYYRYSAMNAGKSTALLQVAYNYEERDQRVLLAKPSIDTKGEGVVSRLGIERSVDLFITPDLNVFSTLADLIDEAEAEGRKIDCILIDEAQFLKREQVNDLFKIAVTKNVPVIAYGIRTDFQANAFEGSARLLEIAHSLEELKTICRCGRKAMLNGRKNAAGEWIREGSQVAIDGEGVTYESMCGKCYLEKVGGFAPATHDHHPYVLEVNEERTKAFVYHEENPTVKFSVPLYSLNFKGKFGL